GQQAIPALYATTRSQLRTPGGVALVPQEALPTDSNGREFRPPNWAERGALEQQQIQQQLQVRRHEPASASGGIPHVHAAASGKIAGSPRTTTDAAPESRPKDEGRRAEHSNITASEASCSTGSSLGGPGGRGAGSEFLRPVASERDIFELLRLPYREPHERNA
ncbi:hypothetical protein Vretifemale_3857, partial [Volvox reticuliferus]